MSEPSTISYAVSDGWPSSLQRRWMTRPAAMKPAAKHSPKVLRSMPKTWMSGCTAAEGTRSGETSYGETSSKRRPRVSTPNMAEHRGHDEESADEHERAERRQVRDRRGDGQDADPAAEVADPVDQGEARRARPGGEVLGRAGVGHRHPQVEAEEDDPGAEERDDPRVPRPGQDGAADTVMTAEMGSHQRRSSRSAVATATSAQSRKPSAPTATITPASGGS